MKKDTQSILILFFISLIAFWQVISLNNCLKWDFIDISLPWRFFIGDSLQNGQLPLWLPYAKLGFPLYFDPQTWYPVSWIIALTTGYSIFTIQAEYVLHVFLAGVGMYYFTNQFSDDNKVRLFASIIFMLSGFFIGNAQHLGWIVSGTWIPFVFNSYLNIYKKKSYLPVFSFSIFLFLLFTGGYFPFFVTTVYSIIVIFIFKSFSTIKNKNYKSLRITILKHAFFTLTFLLISLVVIFSLLETSEFIGRGNGISIEKALNQSIEFEALLTFIFPFSTMWGNLDFWGADKTVINSYFGILPFIILLFSIFIKKNKTELLLLIIGIFSYIIAMGNVFPIRKIFYYTLPLFKYFRFPSLFRFFGILTFSVLVAIILKKIVSEKQYLKNFKRVLIFFIATLVSIFIFSYSKANGINLSINNWFDYIKNISIYETIAVQSIIHIFTLLSIIIVLYLNKGIAKKLTLIIIIASFDMLFSSQLNAPQTVFSEKSAKNLQSKINLLPKGFPIPNNQEKIKDIKLKNFSPVWRNKEVFYKKNEFDGHGPYQLKNFTEFELSGFANDLLNNNLFYFAKNFHPISGNIDTVFIKNNSEGIVLTDDYNLINGGLEAGIGKFSVSIKEYKPKKIKLSVNCSKKIFLVFLHNYKSDWKVYIDNHEQKNNLVNYSLQGVIVPKGKHEVIFSFENNIITNMFYVSAMSFILLLIAIIYLLIK